MSGAHRRIHAPRHGGPALLDAAALLTKRTAERAFPLHSAIRMDPSTSGLMEPAGVEPASANRSLSASTCVVRGSVFLVRSSACGPPIPDQSRGVSPEGGATTPAGQPDFRDASRPTSGRVERETGAQGYLRSQRQFSVGTYWFAAVYEVAAPRHAAPTSLNTSIPCRPLHLEIYAKSRPWSTVPGPATVTRLRPSALER